MFKFTRRKKGAEIGSGKPGQARVKALEKREKTLLVEYLAKNKANVVRDRRIGVRSGDQVRASLEHCHGFAELFFKLLYSLNPQEEAMVERFAKERARETRGGQFRLGGEDDEDEDSVLTHGGKALR